MPTVLHPTIPFPVFSVILIEDSEEDRFALRRLLRRSQSDLVFDIREADTGARGLALCRERLPNCLLLDYGLNDTDGLSLLAELNTGRDPDADPICPVVILTGTGTLTEVAVRALKEGAQDYLVKEALTPAGIVIAMENAVEKVRLRRELRAAEERFRLSLDNMLDSFGIYTAVRDHKSGVITDFRCEYVNQAAISSNGRMPNDQIGHLLFEEYVQVVETGQPLEKTDLNYRNAVRADQEAYLDGVLHIRVWRLGDGFAAVWRDVTVQKLMAASLAAAAIKDERIAETLQRSMLQESPPGKFSGLAVETLYQAALNEAAVGGDFFDAFALNENQVALVVGDVSGKGLVAASRTAEVKYALRAFLYEYPAPEIALAHLNGFIYETHRLDTSTTEAFIVMALAVVNTATGEAAFSAAGAEPSLILRTGGMAEQVETTGWPLGIEPDAAYTAKTLWLASGETVLMATDGITEARRGDAFLGIEGMAALAEKAGLTLSLPELSQAIYGGARNFADGGLRDDVCLLLARRQ